jgi:PAS domain S-box-containing protein
LPDRPAGTRPTQALRAFTRAATELNCELDAHSVLRVVTACAADGFGADLVVATAFHHGPNETARAAVGLDAIALDGLDASLDGASLAALLSLDGRTVKGATITRGPRASGALVVGWREAERQVSDDDRALLEAFASLAAQALALARWPSALPGLHIAPDTLHRAILSNYPSGAVVVFDHELRYTFAEGKGLDEVGLSRALLEGRTIWEVFPPATSAAIEGDYRAALEGRVTRNEVAYNGKTYLTSTIPVRDSDGTVLGGMVVTHDLSDRVAAEVALRESEERHRLLFEKANEAIWILEAEGPEAGTIRAANAASAKMHGYTVDELVGQSITILDVPDVAADAPDKIRRILEGEWVDGQVPHVRKDGTRFPIEFSAGLLDVGRRKYILAFSRDITERVRARELADDMMRELESFSWSVAHDLRAPLRSIDGYSQALVEDYGATLDGDGQRFLAYIRESTRQMAQLIDDLLTLSRVSRSEVRAERVDLALIARDVAERLRQLNPGRAVTLVVAPSIPALGDARLLRVVLDNLLGNAWKFSAKRADARVEVGEMLRGGERVFFVRDNGAGFDMTYIDKLFGVFQRLHSASEFEGTGVGLATVRRILRRHRGRVWAEGAVGVGATFFFTLDPEAQAS